VEPAWGALHEPSVAPLAIVQIPEQQSAFLPQTSRPCTQKEAPIWQRPPLHRLEQQSLPTVQAFPAVLQEVDSAVHLFASQLPPQHSAAVWQACPS